MAEKRRRRRKKRIPADPVETTIETLSNEGRGIARVDGRTVFVDQALAGETVSFKYTRLNSKIAEAKVVEVIKASSQRVDAKCSVFGICGGCSLQHMSADDQQQLKQDTLLQHLKHMGSVAPEKILPVLSGPLWGYRHKARLSVRNVPKKNKVLVGFRERGASYVTDTSRCEILHPKVGSLIEVLSDCIGALEIKEKIPQIEVAVGDEQVVLVFRHLEAMPDADREQLRQLAQQHELVVYLQAGSPDKLEALWPEKSEKLFYYLPAHNVRIEFEPSDFTQVNPEINRKMIDRTIELLNLKKNDRVLDLFSGLGNFSIPMARYCEEVTAVEGGINLVHKGRENAELNKLDNIEFVLADLYSDEIKNAPWLKKSYDKVLLDPPRSGAEAVLKYLAKMGAKCIVYVSCHPATLARDAAVLVNELGYTLTDAGIMDMFPHTAHVESIAVFKK